VFDYTIVELDAFNKPLLSPRSLPAANDLAAYRVAKDLVSEKQCTIEIWLGCALVWRMQPSDTLAPAQNLVVLDKEAVLF
jgi:hypothetical protein